MYALKSQDQGLITLSQQDYLPILVESFLIDRRSQGLSPDTIEFYTKKLQYFQKYCERQALTQISQLTSDFIRRYLLELSEIHNPGGVHACFRPLRTMLYWIEEEEIMPRKDMLTDTVTDTTADTGRSEFASQIPLTDTAG